MSKAEQTTQMNYELRPVREGFALDGTSANAARAKLLLDFNHAVVSQLDLDSLLKLIFRSVQEMFQQTIAATLSIYDTEKDELRIHLLHSDDPDLFREGMPLPLEGSPSGLAFTTRQTVLIHRLVYEDFPSTLIKRALADGIKSGCSVPLISHNRVVGALTVGAAQEGAYRTTDAELLTQIGAQISMPIENALNFRTAERERDRNRLLLEVNNAVASNLDLRQLLQAITTCLRAVMPHDATGLAVWDEDIKQLRMHAVQANDPGPIAEGQPIPLEGTPSGLAFKTGQTVLRDRNDFEEFYSPYFRKMIEAIGLRCGCNVPLKVQGRVIGVLSLGSYQEAAFDRQDANLLEQIASQLAIAVENALNFQRAERERDRKQLLLKINNAVVSHLDLQDLVKTISATLRDIMPHDAAGIALYEPELNHLREYTNVSYKELNAFKVGDTIPIEGTPAGQVFLTGKPLLIRRPNPAEYPGDRYSQLPIEDSPKSACLAPLVSHGRKLGIAGVSSTQVEKFTEEDLELFSQVAGQIAIAVQNTLNFEQANKERKRAEILLEVNNAITSNLELQELIRATSACLHGYFNHDLAGLALYDENRKQLIVHAMDRNDKNPFTKEGIGLANEGSPMALAFTSGRRVLRGHVDFDEFPAAEMREGYEVGWRSFCNVPLVAHDRSLGVLGLISYREDAFSLADADLLESIAGQVALAVENTLQFREIESLKNKLTSEKLYLEEEIKVQYNFAEIVGESSPLREVLLQVETVAPTDSTVLLIGETGTGKELIARAIHNLSSRHERTLVKLNCAAIPTGLLESELFGHEKGAFTGAIAQRVGRFELAHKGTLLLDEIGEIPLELQPKLLRVLQEHEFERLGSSRTVKTDARLVAATNCDLAQMVEEKKFRSDLFYRLNVFPIVIPPLRERTGDIPLLVGYFAQKHAARMNKKIQTIPTKTMQALCSYRWPGNVRELENFIERSVILSRGTDLQSPLRELQGVDEIHADGHPAQGKPQLTTMDEMERGYIEEVLRHTNGSIGGKDGAAEILGMPASTLRGRMKKLGIR